MWVLENGRKMGDRLRETGGGGLGEKGSERDREKTGKRVKLTRTKKYER